MWAIVGRTMLDSYWPRNAGAAALNQHLMILGRLKKIELLNKNFWLSWRALALEQRFFRVGEAKTKAVGQASTQSQEKNKKQKTNAFGTVSRCPNNSGKATACIQFCCDRQISPYICVSALTTCYCRLQTFLIPDCLAWKHVLFFFHFYVELDHVIIHFIFLSSNVWFTLTFHYLFHNLFAAYGLRKFSW